jgi:hypothetical protein
VRGEPAVSRTTYLTVCQVGQDTMPASRRTVLEVVLDPLRPSPPTTTDVAEATAYPTETARRYLSELAAVRLVDRLPGGPGKADHWAVSERLRTLLADMQAPVDGALGSQEVSREMM